MSPMLEEVLRVSQLGEEGEPRRIPRELVRKWTSSNDLEVLGAIFHMLDQPQIWNRVFPPLSPEEYQDLFLDYTRRCIVENPRGEWVDSRYEAGWNLANWIKVLGGGSVSQREMIEGVVRVLEELYRDGNSEIRRAIVDAVLEHVFEEPLLIKYFSKWRGSPPLDVAYGEAMQWNRPKKL